MKKALRPFPTLIALSAAAAFGGFAATGLNDLLQKPANAAPAAASSSADHSREAWAYRSRYSPAAFA